MKDKIVLVGGGGHCKACIDVIESEERFEIAGIVDKKEKFHQKVLGYEVFANDDDLSKLIENHKNFLITIGQAESFSIREEKFNYLKSLGAEFPPAISPLAHVSSHAHVGQGTIVMHGALVGSDVTVGANCIINTGAIIEHGSVIGDFCHISTGSVVNGECRVGKGTFLGSGSVISNGVTVGDNVVLGAGSVVIESINKSGKYAGVPARRLD